MGACGSTASAVDATVAGAATHPPKDSSSTSSTVSRVQAHEEANRAHEAGRPEEEHSFKSSKVSYRSEEMASRTI